MILLLRAEWSNDDERLAWNKSAGGVMRVALAIVAVVAVTFLLRVLVALLKEASSKPLRTVVHFATFKPSRRGGELTEMNTAAQRQEVTTDARQRIAL